MAQVPTRHAARPPLDRMMHIHQALQVNRYPNCLTLARELEVVPRTIKRDVDFMKCRLGLPISYDRRHQGYRYTEPVEHFPNLTMTEGELFALLVAHKAIAQYHGTPFQRMLETAFQKLTGRLDTETRFTLGNLDAAFSFRPFAPEDADLQTFEVLTRAVRERRVVRFQYRNLGTRQIRPRQVRPYHLACIENHWYLFGFDEDRQAMRTFVLARLRAPELTSSRFTLEGEFDLNTYLRGSLAVFRGAADYEVVVDFDAWAGDLIRGRRWHASQDLTELPSGEVRVRLRLDSLEEAERWVLGWGVHATVVRPEGLAARIREIAGVLAQRYARPE
ncbi:MAG: WYL domain-containing protein [Verrucomicrobiales bacterium]|nr:WYL domain-containing protein [Verrucomicrobiales bacterium]